MSEKPTEIETNVRQETWNGLIPVVVNLAKNELNGGKTPQPYYCLLPRCSYLPLFVDEIHNHFLDSISSPSSSSASSSSSSSVQDAWFEYQGEPLRWHLFIGVLFDLYGGGGGEGLPWALTVHFQDFPSKSLVRCENTKAMKDYYFQCLKEACTLKHKSSSAVNNNLSDIEQDRLWKSVEKQLFSEFWELNTKLNHEEETECLPVKICLKNKPPIMRPIPASENITLLSLLETHLPELFPSEGEGDVVSYPKVLVQGIFVPFDFPVRWLCDHCMHPDNFLFVCVLGS